MFLISKAADGEDVGSSPGITNYSPAETYEAAAVLKPSNKKPKHAAAAAAPVQL